jgi:hypothetical protein
VIRTWLAVAAVALIAIFAAADALRGGADRPEPPATAPPPPASGLRGPDMPQAATLEGILYLAGPDCALQALDLATLTLGEKSFDAGCDFDVGPTGLLASVLRESVPGRDGRVVWLARLDGKPRLVRPVGLARGQVTWAPEGESVAWCGEDFTTFVLDVGETQPRAFPGCRPKIGADLTVLTRPTTRMAGELLRDGEVVLSESELGRGLPADADGPLDVLGYDANRDGLLAVSVVRHGEAAPEPVLELWADGDLERSIALPRFGDTSGSGSFAQVVRFSPDGSEVAAGLEGSGRRIALYDVRSGATLLEPTRQVDFDWSPDGRWFAVATGTAVEFYGAGRASPAYILPVPARRIAWRSA